MLTLLLAWWRRRALVGDPRYIVRATTRQASVVARARTTVATATIRNYEVRA